MNKFWLVYAENEYDGTADYYLFSGSKEEAEEWSQQAHWRNQKVELLTTENFHNAYDGIALLSTI